MSKLTYLIFSNIKYYGFNILLTLIILSALNTNINAYNYGIDINFLKKSLIHPDSVYTIVIDAGHGGRDKGTSYKGIFEKDITLAIAKRIKSIVENNYDNINVILTRKNDIFIPLYERIRIANRAKADIFLSIHCNSYLENSNINGNEIYILGLTDSEENLDVAMRENASVLLEGDYKNNYDWYDPNSIEAHIFLSAYQNMFLDQSLMLANKISANIEKKSNIKSRGIKQAGFILLKYATMPSILIETGFITNSEDRKKMNSISGQDKLANSIAWSISCFLKNMN